MRGDLVGLLVSSAVSTWCLREEIGCTGVLFWNCSVLFSVLFDVLFVCVYCLMCCLCRAASCVALLLLAALLFVADSYVALCCS